MKGKIFKKNCLDLDFWKITQRNFRFISEVKITETQFLKVEKFPYLIRWTLLSQS